MTHISCRLAAKTGISSGTLHSVIEYGLPFIHARDQQTDRHTHRPRNNRPHICTLSMHCRLIIIQDLQAISSLITRYAYNTTQATVDFCSVNGVQHRQHVTRAKLFTSDKLAESNRQFSLTFPSFPAKRVARTNFVRGVPVPPCSHKSR